jgi:hypothetical protein
MLQVNVVNTRVWRWQWPGGWRWQWPANPPGFDPESGRSRGVAPDPCSEAEWGWGKSPNLKKCSKLQNTQV